MTQDYGHSRLPPIVPDPDAPTEQRMARIIIDQVNTGICDGQPCVYLQFVDGTFAPIFTAAGCDKLIELLIARRRLMWPEN